MATVGSYGHNGHNRRTPDGWWCARGPVPGLVGAFLGDGELGMAVGVDDLGTEPEGRADADGVVCEVGISGDRELDGTYGGDDVACVDQEPGVCGHEKTDSGNADLGQTIA